MTKRPVKCSRILGDVELAAVVGGDGSESRNIEFELIKNEVQQLSQTQPATQAPPK